MAPVSCGVAWGSTLVRAISLGYHDVIAAHEAREPRSSSVYTIPEESFGLHLRMIRFAAGAGRVCAVTANGERAAQRLYFTFDDGAACAATRIAPELERYGWPGHFFVTTDWIGRPGFLTPAQIRQMHRRGHIIGSHSCSHPERMSHLSWDELIREWSRSCAVLGDIIGRPVVTASLAGGYYSPAVARAAAACGIKVLFTSEPTTALWDVDGCLVLGRYTVRRSTPARTVAAIAAGATLPRLEQALAWAAKKVVKRVTGTYYDVLREVLGRRIQHP
jgi:peptidoglycan/xylan/chitin deacetylase (PgdA/CDA1 family)